MQNFTLFGLFVVLLLSKGYAEDVLYTVESNAKLFTGKNWISGIYDGDDSIYLFGGWSGTASKEITKYSISTDSVTAEQSLPYGTRRGGLAVDSDGSIHYIGGDGANHVQRFDPISGSVNVVGPVKAINFGSAQTEERSCILYGGVVNDAVTKNINRWDMDTLRLYKIGELPSSITGYTAVTFLNADRKVYHIRNDDATNKITIFLHDLVSNVTEILPDVIPDGFVRGNLRGVSDGTYVYLFGNIRTHHNSSFVKYEIATNTASIVPIIDYPGVFDQGLYDTEPVYVPKLNRIYLFGGITEDPRRYYDGIWYIDLPHETVTEETTESESPTTTTMYVTTETTEEVPLSTTTEARTTTTPLPEQVFNCSHRLDGFYPHPEDCARYFGCQGGHSTPMRCPEPLIYHAEFRVCAFPSQAECHLTCEGRDDGMHPHPYYCHYYIGCFSGEMYLFECDPPFLFDPIVGNCNYPNMVECLVDY